MPPAATSHLPRLSHPVKLLCRRCRNSGSSSIQIRLYLFLELRPMRQDVRRTHLVPIVHGVQLVNRSVSSVTNIEPMGMGVEMVDVQSILFQKGCCQFCCIVLRLLIRRIICRGHNALDSNGSSVAVSRTVSGVPAAQAVGRFCHAHTLST